MTTRPHRSPQEGGSVLLVTLIITAILGTALASYMKLAEYQNRSVVHSEYWNGGIPLAEAGVEEALTHLNQVENGERATNGWVFTNNTYYLTRTLDAGRYEVWIDTASQPAVKAIGYVHEPLSDQEVDRTVQVTTTRSGSIMRGIIAKESITMSGGGVRIDSFDSSNPAYSTNGRYDNAKSRDNGFAGAVNGSITTGNGGIWGSAATGPNGSFSGNVGSAAWLAANNGQQPGRYTKDLNISFPDVKPPFSGGAQSPAVNALITVTNYTYLTSQTTATTYPNPEPAGGVSTSVQTVTTVSKPVTWSGTLTTNTAATSTTTYPAAGTYVGNVVTRSVVQGKGKKATTVTYYDYAAITGYSYEATAYTYNTITTNASYSTDTYAYAFGNGNYQMSSLSMSGQNKMIVTGDTVLYVTGNVSFAGQSYIVILPNASLKLYVAGSIGLHGNGVMNLSQNATKYQVLGLPSCTAVALGGNAEFTGTIYAPEAHVSMGGGGNNTYDTVGAIVAKSVSMNGHFNFHYDELLGRTTGPIQYKVASWNEL